MAYGWWRRRRRRWKRWRRRPKWRRRWRTRRRRPAGRRRRRRTVRRRRRGRWRSRYRRWRRKGRRKRKKKLIIRQWQPNYTRKCNIVGYMPVIMCGENTVIRNYATHADDCTYPGPFGGGMATQKFTLRILYDDYKRFMNYWTSSNEDLDLCRYRGVTLYFFRDPDVDFIILINTTPPFVDTEITGPSIHPGMLALNKRARFIPSLKTRPGRRHIVKIKVGAPRMYEDKWYPQSELCDMPLLTIYATATDMQHPFGSPLTDTPVVSFQVLRSMYNDALSILPSNFENSTSPGQKLHKEISEYIPYYNTTETIAQLKRYVENTEKSQSTPNPWQSKYVNTKQFTTAETITTQTPYTTFADTWYRGTAYTQNIKNVPLKAAELYESQTKNLLSTTFTGGSKYLEYHGGLYSSIWLSAGRSYFETKGAYTDICYNPYTDRGEGNMLWIDWLVKTDSKYDKTRSKCLIEKLPLWAAVYGYAEYCAKATGDSNIDMNARVVIRCPYTTPQMIDTSDPSRGFIVYSFNFGKGKMPGGSNEVPIRMRAKWYPCLFHQKEVLEAIGQSGPFAYHSDQKKAVLGLKYRFHWIWGGNPVFPQVVRNPCKDTQGSTGPRKPRSIQIIDPKYNTPELTIHAWDFRRGFFGPKAIKRMQQQPTDAELLPPGRKRSRRDTEVMQSSQERQKESLLFQQLQLQRRVPPWESSQGSQTETESQKEQEGTLSQQLREQLQQQKLLGKQLREMFLQLHKIQQNQHVNPILLPRDQALISWSQIQ
uniref:Capsid protein n=2 Tax=Anelloviridae TaxID=687329 RepID=A0AAU8H409_9VIRU